MTNGCTMYVFHSDSWTNLFCTFLGEVVFFSFVSLFVSSIRVGDTSFSFRSELGPCLARCLGVLDCGDHPRENVATTVPTMGDSTFFSFFGVSSSFSCKGDVIPMLLSEEGVGGWGVASSSITVLMLGGRARALAAPVTLVVVAMVVAMVAATVVPSLSDDVLSSSSVLSLSRSIPLSPPSTVIISEGPIMDSLMLSWLSSITLWPLRRSGGRDWNSTFSSTSCGGHDTLGGSSSSSLYLSFLSSSAAT